MEGVLPDKKIVATLYFEIGIIELFCAKARGAYLRFRSDICAMVSKMNNCGLRNSDLSFLLTLCYEDECGRMNVMMNECEVS